MGLVPYMGGDALQVKYIARLLPDGERFVEAFGGGGSVTLFLARTGRYQEIIWNDIDYGLYAAFYVVKHYPEVFPVLDDIFSFIKDAILNGEKDGLRVFIKQLIGDLVSAKNTGMDVFTTGIYALLVYHTCYFNIYRNSTMIRWTDPEHTKIYRNIPKKLQKLHSLLQRVKLLNRDAIELLSMYDTVDTVFYLDPPHIGYNYYIHNFELGDVVRLVRALKGIRHAKVLLKISVKDLPYYRVLENHGWRITSRNYLTQTRKTTVTYYFLHNYPAHNPRQQSLDRFLQPV